jgi:broad specificity phosphatase PhoE
MPIVRVARHGETTWNAQGRYQGRHDTPLSNLGIAQARALADALSAYRIGKVVSSPLERCRATASPFCEERGLPLTTNALLVEIAHGAWEGRYREDLQREDPQRLKAWKTDPEHVSFPAGESVLDVRARWERFVETFVPHEDSLLVTHDVVARLAILHAGQRPAAELWTTKVRNGAFAAYRVEGHRWTLLEECVDGHLTHLASDPALQAL